MIDYKTKEQIETMQKGGKMLSETLWEVMGSLKVGMSELEVDALAEKLILKKGGEPGFKKVEGYKHTICSCVNDVVVHGIPSRYTLNAGDVICVDCGVFYNGFHTDMAETIMVGKASSAKREEEITKFLDTGKRALFEAIKVAMPGNRIGDISKTIQDIVEKEGGYSIVRNLIGHGVGRELHEDPEVPGFLDRPIEKTPLLKEGMTIAIEVIYNMGGPEVIYKGKDGWSIASKDGSLSAVFERSVAITKTGHILLTE